MLHLIQRIWQLVEHYVVILIWLLISDHLHLPIFVLSVSSGLVYPSNSLINLAFVWTASIILGIQLKLELVDATKLLCFRHDAVELHHHSHQVWRLDSAVVGVEFQTYCLVEVNLKNLDVLWKSYWLEVFEVEI